MSGFESNDVFEIRSLLKVPVKRLVVHPINGCVVEVSEHSNDVHDVSRSSGSWKAGWSFESRVKGDGMRIEMSVDRTGNVFLGGFDVSCTSLKGPTTGGVLKKFLDEDVHGFFVLKRNAERSTKTLKLSLLELLLVIHRIRIVSGYGNRFTKNPR